MTERFCNVWEHPNIDSNLYDKQTEEILSISDIEDYDFTGKKIVAVIFDDKSIDCNAIVFKELYSIIIDKLYQKVPEAFSNNDIKKLLSIQNDITAEKANQYVQLNDNLFVKYDYNANSAMKKISKLCSMFNLDDDLLLTLTNKSDDDNIELN